MPLTHPRPGQQAIEEQEALLQELRTLAPSGDILAGLRAAVAATSRFLPPAVGASTAAATEIAAALQGPLVAPYVANIQLSMRIVGAAMASTPARISPELAMSIQETENAWREIEEEFGFVSSVEAASLLGSKKGNRTVASDRRTAGKILGVLRGNSYRYPRFQFDQARGGVWPVIPEVIALAHANGWTDEDLLLWFCAPTAFFPEEDRPVDHMSEPTRVLAAAKDEFEDRW